MRDRASLREYVMDGYYSVSLLEYHANDDADWIELAKLEKLRQILDDVDAHWYLLLLHLLLRYHFTLAFPLNQLYPTYSIFFSIIFDPCIAIF